MAIKPWKLISKQDISPSPWFPLEKRQYELPDGSVVDDFYVTTIEDAGLVIPITRDGMVIMVRQFKPGANQLTLEFPGGRLEAKHADLKTLAWKELAEEVGVEVDIDSLIYLGKFNGFTTKGSEWTHYYVVFDCEINATQSLDETEFIEIVVMSPEEIDRLILNNELNSAVNVAAWTLAKAKYPKIFSK